MSGSTYALLAFGTCFGVAVLMSALAIYEDETVDGGWIIETTIVSVVAGALWPLLVIALAVGGCAYPLAQYAKRRKAKQWKAR